LIAGLARLLKLSVAIRYTSVGKQNLHILHRDLLVLEVDHIDLVLEGHRIVLPVAEDLQDSRLELDQQPAV